MDLSSVLHDQSREWTLSDVSLAFRSYRDLDRFRNGPLAELGIQPDSVEDVLPCSPMQEAILASQRRDPEAYRTCFVFEAVSAPDMPVDCARLQQAWRAVVRRHSLLRALLLGNVAGSSETTIVVLRDPQLSISVFQAAESVATPELFRARYSPVDQQADGLQHHLSICQLEDQRVYLCLDINYAIVDAHSRDIMMHDLQTAYGADLDPNGSQFKNVISYLLRQPQEEAGHYWASQLDGVKPCYLPSMAVDGRQSFRDGTVQLPGLNTRAIFAYCQMMEVTPATVLQTAWAMVLSYYTGSITSCFGIFCSGRDLPVNNVSEIFGPLITMLPCRVHLLEKLTVAEALRSVQNNFISSLPFQIFPLSSTKKVLGIESSELFNTALNL
jgi:hypothetical protein